MARSSKYGSFIQDLIKIGFKEDCILKGFRNETKYLIYQLNSNDPNLRYELYYFFEGKNELVVGLIKKLNKRKYFSYVSLIEFLDSSFEHDKKAVAHYKRIIKKLKELGHEIN